MIKDILSSDPESPQYKMINNAMNSVEVLRGRLEELLDLARFTRGAFKIKPQQIDTCEFLERAALRYKTLLKQKRQQLIIEISSGLPHVEADPSRVEQVISNLLSNAAKYSPENSQINLRAYLKDYCILVEVKDQGIGISPEDQKDLFTPYHRVDKDRQNYSGIGLGLAVSRQIVEAHGGRIWVESERSKGSSFKLPCR
jgi:signal transduction histidine kinase